MHGSIYRRRENIYTQLEKYIYEKTRRGVDCNVCGTAREMKGLGNNVRAAISKHGRCHRLAGLGMRKTLTGLLKGMVPSVLLSVEGTVS
ncbi:hypothetical protein XELAEV_18004487mg, partial [Xenopus laevis]